MVEITMHADSAQNRVRRAGGTVDVKAAGDNAVDDVLYLLFGCALLHYDDHVSSSTLKIFCAEHSARPVKQFGTGVRRPLQKAAATKFEKSLCIFPIRRIAVHGNAFGGARFVNDAL